MSGIVLSGASTTGWSSAIPISGRGGIRLEAFGALQWGDGTANSWNHASLCPGDLTPTTPAVNREGAVFWYGAHNNDSSHRSFAKWTCITNTSYALGSVSGLPTGEFWLDTPRLERHQSLEAVMPFVQRRRLRGDRRVREPATVCRRGTRRTTLK